MLEVSPLLELEGVTKRFDGIDAGGPEVLRGLSLTVATGESLGVIGPSGCGKSTLLNVIGTLDRPTSGRVLLDNRDVTQLDDDELALLRNREIGFIFQLHHLLPQCTALENVLVPTLAGGAGATADAEQHARRLLERVGLADRMNYRPGQLSGGERQRVAVVRALINRPKLVLADEPTGSLDRKAADNLAEVLVGLNREEGITLILVTHAMHLAEHMQRVVELRDGVLVEATSGS